MALSLPQGSFFGQTTRVAEFEGITVSVSAHRRGEQTPVHFHERPYACLVLEGLFCEAADGLDTVFEPGVWAFHPTAHKHRDRFLAGSTCLNLTFTDLGASPKPLVKRSKRLHSYATSVRSLLAKGDQSRDLLEAKALALACVLTEGSDPEPAPAWLFATNKYLSRSIGPHVTPSWLAEAFEIHPVRAYRNHFGEGIESAIELARLDRAKALLEKSDSSLAEIALTCGFSSQSRMCKVFRNREGVAPGQFRRKVRS